MDIDWESSETKILMNSRFSLMESGKLASLIKESSALKSHFWLSTSGSTGQVKWAALSKEAILCSARSVNHFLHSTSQDIWINPLPSFHVGGLGIWARGYLSGAKVIDFYKSEEGKWDPGRYYQALIETKATLSSLVPAQVYDLISKEIKASPFLRGVIVGGGALQPSLYKQAKDLGWTLLPSYGMTECASQIATASLDAMDERGMPSLKILDHVDINLTAEGLIQVRSAALLSLYAVVKEDAISFYDPKIEGWFTTEDRGEVIETTLKILGRDGSFIKIGGESVDMTRLEKMMEEILLELKIRLDATLLAVPDERLGHVVHFVAAVKDEKIVRHCVEAYRQRVLPFERIRKVHYVDCIPRSPLQKVLKVDLLKQVLDG